MDSVSNAIAWDENCRADAVRPREIQDCERDHLRRVAVVLSDDASKFGAAADLTLGFRD